MWRKADVTLKVHHLKTCLIGHATDVLQKNYVLFKIMKYHYHHQRPLEIMVEMLIIKNKQLQHTSNYYSIQTEYFDKIYFS